MRNRSFRGSVVTAGLLCLLLTSCLDDNTLARFLMMTAGGHHVCGVLEDNTVKCWGYNLFGQLGLGNMIDQGDDFDDMGDNLPRVALGTNRLAAAVAAGGSHSCVLLDDSTVKCWGENGSGQLGQDDTNDRGDVAGEMGDNLPAINLGAGLTALAIAAGGGHTCTLLDDSTVKCWGENGSGQLGQGDTADRGDAAGEMALLAAIPLPLPAVAIAVGGEHTCALLNDSTVRCWGENSSGQLGRGNPDDQGDAAGEIAALTAIDLGTGRTALAIAAGVTHTCARLDNSTVKCWGDNDFGQLGLGNTASRGDDAGEMGDLLPAIDLGTGRTVLAITAGQDGSCAGLDNFTVKCWGYNLYGQLGLGNTANRGDGINEMGDNLPAIALGTDRTVAAISSGLFHNCALLDDGTGRCWGYNIFGQLGQGDIGNRGDGGGEMGNNLLQINVGTL